MSTRHANCWPTWSGGDWKATSTPMSTVQPVQNLQLEWDGKLGRREGKLSWGATMALVVGPVFGVCGTLVSVVVMRWYGSQG